MDWEPSANTSFEPVSSSSFFLHPLGRPEALLRQGKMPGQRLVLRDQDVGVPVAGEIDQAQVRIVPIELGQRGKDAEFSKPPTAVRS
jgi:hypothetical protein